MRSLAARVTRCKSRWRLLSNQGILLPLRERDLADLACVRPMTYDQVPRRLQLRSLLLLSAWCGLVAGLLEVGTIVIRKEMFDANQLYGISHHFIWLIPLTNLGVFLALGFSGWMAGLIWPRSVRWLLTRILCTLVLLPMPLIAFPRIYTAAWLVLTLGLATRLVPRLEINTGQFSEVCSGKSPSGSGGAAFVSGVSLDQRPDQAISRKCTSVASAGVAQSAPDRARHRRGKPSEPVWLPPSYESNSGSSLPSGGSSLIPLSRLPHGPYLPMQQYLQDDGCTSFRSAGSTRLTKDIPRWLSSSAVGGTQRPASSQIRHIAPRYGLESWLHALRGFHLPRVHRTKDGGPGKSPAGGVRKSLTFRGVPAIAGQVATLCAGALAGMCLRSQGCINCQS